MQETVKNTNERKSLFSSLLEVLKAKEKQTQAERQLQEEKYLRRTQRIYDFHDRQCREAVELRRCLDYVSQHAHALEAALRGLGGAGGGAGGDAGAAGDAVPLSAALVRQAAALRGSMAQCVRNAARIRQLVAATHQTQMDALLAKMEAELSSWTAFLQRAVDASYNTEVVIDNLNNMIVEQHRCVREVSASCMFTSLCGASPAQAPPASPAPVSPAPASPAPSTPLMERRAPSVACSTPIARE